MSHVEIPDNITAFIKDRIRHFADEALSQLKWQAPYVAEFEALPLYLGWFETIGIRSDGGVIRWSTEGEYAGARPVEDRSWVMTGLVEGSRRYSELLPLLPVRTPDAVDCECQVYAHLVTGQLICKVCGGLGWFPL